MVDRARIVALKLLREAENKKTYINLMLKSALRENNISALDKAFITDIVYGVTRYRLKLDWLIERYSKGAKPSPWVRHVLRMGMYQILYMDKVPDFAACNSSVELAKMYASKSEAGYVNAVLRRLIREKENVDAYLPRDPFLKLSIKHSYPEWIIRLWSKNLDLDFVDKLCASQNIRAPLTIRVNELKISRDELLRLFAENGVPCSDGVYLPEAITIERSLDIESLPGYAGGFFTVQSEASMMVSHAVAPKPGCFIIDACAAPGGKTAHMAQLVQNNGRIMALDIYPQRVELIKERCAALGITCVEPLCYDSTVYNEEWRDLADIVLIDAPCSGLGIIRRKPDIKWLRSEKDIKSLTDIQRRLLNTCSRYVKPGGALIYSTCTIDVLENQNMISDFLTAHDEFVLDDVYKYLPDGIGKFDYRDDKWVQLYPNEDKVDGFFIARLLRKR